MHIGPWDPSSSRSLIFKPRIIYQMACISMASDTMKARLFALGIAALFMLMAFSTVAEAKGKPTFVNDQQGDRWVLKNDQISIWFQGKKPMLMVLRKVMVCWY